MQRAARTVQPSLSALGSSVSGLPRGLRALLQAPLRRSVRPSVPPPAPSPRLAPSPYLAEPAAGGGWRGTRGAAATDAAEMAPAAAGDGPLEYELQQACVAVRLASALCQVSATTSAELASAGTAVGSPLQLALQSFWFAAMHSSSAGQTPVHAAPAGLRTGVCTPNPRRRAPSSHPCAVCLRRGYSCS